MGYFGLKMKMKDSVNMDGYQLTGCGYQLTGWLLCNDAGNQAKVRFCEFSVNYIILHSFTLYYIMVVFFYFGCNYLVCNFFNFIFLHTAGTCEIYVENLHK